MVCDGEGMVTTLAVPRVSSRWLNGRTLIATWKGFREHLSLKFTCTMDDSVMTRLQCLEFLCSGICGWSVVDVGVKK